MANFTELLNIDEDSQSIFLNGFRKVITISKGGALGATAISTKDRKDNKAVIRLERDKSSTRVLVRTGK